MAVWIGTGRVTSSWMNGCFEKFDSELPCELLNREFVYIMKELSVLAGN